MWRLFVLVLSVSATCPQFYCNQTESIDCIQVFDSHVEYHPCPGNLTCPVTYYNEVTSNISCVEIEEPEPLEECAVYGEEGDSCDEDHLCGRSFYCGTNEHGYAICIKVKKLGQKCVSHFECREGTVCNQGRCIQIFSLDEGTAAETRTACKSGRLKGGVCLKASITVGDLPKICLTDEDCKSSIGEPGECFCGANELGQAYCSLHESDEPVMDYLAAARNEDMEEAYRRLLKAADYALIKGTHDCWDDIIGEVVDYEDSKEYMDRCAAVAGFTFAAVYSLLA